MKLIKILSALAVFAAAGMVLAGCDNLAGSGSGKDEAAFAETTATESAGGTIAGSATGTKTVKVKFEVKNGGSNAGIVSTQDDSYLVYGRDIFNAGNDYTITITVPASDEYLNIRWKGLGAFLVDNTYLKAKMKAESGTITLDYNGVGKVATKNLYDVYVTTTYSQDWEDAEKRAVKN